MKIFQILNNVCYYDITSLCPTLADTVGKYPPAVKFVETPDYVFEGWGYDESKTGDERFIKPTPPDGWIYDDASGCFYPEEVPTPESRYQTLTELKTKNTQLEAKVKALTESSQILEDCLVEMAEIVYA